MPTQVRIFTLPRSLGETLAAPITVPDYPAITRSVYTPTARIRLGTMSGYDEKSKGGITFAHQDKLPKLPIPDLESSCQKYLTALKPLQSAREHGETKHAVEEFLRHDGPELQAKLKKYAEKQTSYIEQFCMYPTLPLDKYDDLLTIGRVRLLPELRQPSCAQSEPILLARR